VRRAAAVVSAAAAILPALALGADPARNSAFHSCKVRDVCDLRFETDRRGRYVQDLRLYPKCAPVPARWPRIRVRQGAFERRGTVRDVTGERLRYAIEGRFTTPRRAVVTFDVDGRDCKDRRRRLVARRHARAKPGI
jgi:hypothetical protein